MMDYMDSGLKTWEPSIKRNASALCGQIKRLFVFRNYDNVNEVDWLYFQEAWYTKTNIKIASIYDRMTECGPLEKGMANHFSILALRTSWTVLKGKMIEYWKRNSPGQ